MSAWLCSQVHISALANAMADRNFFAPERAAGVAQALFDENIKSLRARYPDSADRFFAPAIHEPFVHTDTHVRSEIVLLKAVHCYNYQSCEHREWTDSAAYRLCQDLEADILRRAGRPTSDDFIRFHRRDYDLAPWGIDEADVARVAA